MTKSITVILFNVFIILFNNVGLRRKYFLQGKGKCGCFYVFCGHTTDKHNKFNTDNFNNDSFIFLYQRRMNNVSYSDGLSMYNNIVKYLNEATTETLGEKITTEINK